MGLKRIARTFMIRALSFFDGWELYAKGLNWALVAWDMDQWLRKEIKYGDHEEYEPVREMLHTICALNGVDLDDIG